MRYPVFISDKLSTNKEHGVTYGLKVYNALKDLDCIEVIEIDTGTPNVWCRDYMPVKNAAGAFVQFEYRPSYMKESKYDQWFPDPIVLHQQIGLEVVNALDFKLDGGNVELHGNKAIVTDRVFRDNNCSTIEQETALRNKLRTELAVEKLIIVPEYPYDFTGHIDGLVRFVDDSTVLINDYTEELSLIAKDANVYRKKILDQWHHTFRNTLYNADLALEILPYGIKEDQINRSAEGIYLNFLLLPDLIIMPIYGNLELDKKASDQLKRLYGRDVHGVVANELSREGGVINCVTWSPD